MTKKETVADHSSSNEIHSRELKTAIDSGQVMIEKPTLNCKF